MIGTLASLGKEQGDHYERGSNISKTSRQMDFSEETPFPKTLFPTATHNLNADSAPFVLRCCL